MPAHDLCSEDVREPEEGDGEEEDGGGELVVEPLQPGVRHGQGPGLGLEEGRDPDNRGEEVHHDDVLRKYQGTIMSGYFLL